MAAHKYLLIANPNAGMLKVRSDFMEIVDTYCQNDIELSVATTQRVGDATRIAAQRGAAFDCIVCTGGDGTFNELIAGVMQLEKKPFIGYIPAGTTNDFASGIGLSSDLVEAARRTVYGQPVPIDVGSFNGRYFSYVASFGAFTGTSYSTPQNIKNAIGHLAYILEGVKDLTNIKPYHVCVKTDEAELEGDYLFGAVSNSTSLGGILKLPPSEVDVRDGVFEVLLVKKPNSNQEFQKIISSVLTQNPDGDVVQMFKASKIRFSMEEQIPWSLDGEYDAGACEVNVENIHHALQIKM